MTKQRESKSRARDLPGLSSLRKISPLLSGLRAVGTQRVTARNRKLFMDQEYVLIPLQLFIPAVSSLLDLQRVSVLGKVQKWFGVTRVELLSRVVFRGLGSGGVLQDSVCENFSFENKNDLVMAVESSPTSAG